MCVWRACVHACIIRVRARPCVGEIIFPVPIDIGSRSSSSMESVLPSENVMIEARASKTRVPERKNKKRKGKREAAIFDRNQDDWACTTLN